MKTNFSKYATRPLDAVGVINHNFVDASKSPGQYDAEQCNRQAVTARWLFEHPDVQGYLYRDGDAEVGLDPWRLIEGVDAKVDLSEFYIEIGRTKVKSVAPNFVVYAPRTAVEKEVAREHEARLDRNPRTKWALDVPMSGEFAEYRTRQVVALTEASLKLEEERRQLVAALSDLIRSHSMGHEANARALLAKLGEES